MNGYILVDKPAGPTSFDVVRTVRRALPKGTKVGHNGTLDPFATGLLIVLVGSATRLMQWLVGHDKRYLLEVQFGATSDSDDATGTLTPTGAAHPSESAVHDAVARLAATTEQMPPQVSAIHVDGERAYLRAKRGEQVAVKPRPVTFGAMDVVSYDPAAGVLTLDVRSTAGTYMRSVARDLGELLECGGHASTLRRLEVGDWSVENAVALDDIDVASDMFPIVNLMNEYPVHSLAEDEVTAVRHGRAVPTEVGEGLLTLVDSAGDAVAVAEVVDGSAHPRVVVPSSREVACTTS
jgi:tRNA pseudouridine55 synthase